MKKIKVMTVFGTRPEAIKMAPLVKELEKHSNYIESIVCVTAQHRQMLDQVLHTFDIDPDIDLNIMTTNQTLSDITTTAISGLSKIIGELKPDIVLVHGDTTTTFAGSLAAFYNQVPVGHVEAGLRTYDKYSPFPEEMNRKLTGSIAELHFSPTIANKNNLLKETIDDNKIFVTGNTVIDAVMQTVKDDYEFENDFLQKYRFEKNIITVTAHRRENQGTPLENICNAVLELSKKYSNLDFIYPVHLNPIIRETANKILGSQENIHLIEPLSTGDMHNLISRSHIILTDSGGLQEEAPSLGKPVLVVRNETERPEAIKAGTAKLAGTDRENIINLVSDLIDNDSHYNAMAHAINPYGDGHASERIVNYILYHFGYTDKKIKEFM